MVNLIDLGPEPMRAAIFTTFALLALQGPWLVSCKIKSDHVIETRHEIKPIEINVNVRVERELDEFFEDLDEASTTVTAEETPSNNNS